jgi:hypothetical protein
MWMEERLKEAIHYPETTEVAAKKLSNTDQCCDCGQNRT